MIKCLITNDDVKQYFDKGIKQDTVCFHNDRIMLFYIALALKKTLFFNQLATRFWQENVGRIDRRTVHDYDFMSFVIQKYDTP